ncbi:hypothetical protein Q9233_006022 [Columba guinea]|nr:hypothetical protein Q9233_006022 [Columba guinea]
MSDASVSMPGMQPKSSMQEPDTTWEELELSCTLDSLYQVQLLEFKSHLGHLDHLFGILMNRVDQLRDTKLDRAELRKLCRLLPGGGQQSMVHILADLQTQASSIQSQVSSLQALEWELQHVKQEVPSNAGREDLAAEQDLPKEIILGAGAVEPPQEAEMSREVVPGIKVFSSSAAAQGGPGQARAGPEKDLDHLHHPEDRAREADVRGPPRLPSPQVQRGPEKDLDHLHHG